MCVVYQILRVFSYDRRVLTSSDVCAICMCNRSGQRTWLYLIGLFRHLFEFITILHLVNVDELIVFLLFVFNKVILFGPAIVAATVFDHGNGSYEAVALIADPGKYSLVVIVERTLCEGMLDPKPEFIARSEYNHNFLKNRYLHHVLKIY